MVEGHGCRVTSVRAAEAVGLFCHQARKCVEAFVVALDGLDTLAFAGRVSENAPESRLVAVCVIRTDEEWMKPGEQGSGQGLLGDRRDLLHAGRWKEFD
ncbi:MAG: hypothetical protein ABR903_01990 [Thermodesulfovibrionales bacterium]